MKSTLKVEHWDVGKLIPYPNNPRNNDAAVDRMCESLRQFGFRIPIIATSDGDVVDGHLRLKAALKLGMNRVPVALADGLSPAKIKAFRLTANHSANWAEWNPEMLAIELDDLGKMEFDVTPFGLDEILPELEDLEISKPRAHRSKTTIFVSVLNADVEKARKVITTALDKAKIGHNL
jgi:hypothetical protein